MCSKDFSVTDGIHVCLECVITSLPVSGTDLPRFVFGRFCHRKTLCNRYSRKCSRPVISWTETLFSLSAAPRVRRVPFWRQRQRQRVVPPSRGSWAQTPVDRVDRAAQGERVKPSQIILGPSHQLLRFGGCTHAVHWILCLCQSRFTLCLAGIDTEISHATLSQFLIPEQNLEFSPSYLRTQCYVIHILLRFRFSLRPGCLCRQRVICFVEGTGRGRTGIQTQAHFFILGIWGIWGAGSGGIPCHLSPGSCSPGKDIYDVSPEGGKYSLVKLSWWIGEV